MLKLIRHLRPFTWSIVLIFFLLFGQAMADLALPGYMADIVNVGIQQGGIRNAVPEAISEGEFEKLTLFMTDTEKEQVEDNYQLLDRQILTQSEYDRYVKEYPGLADSPLYVSDIKNEDITEQLSPVFSRSILVVMSLKQIGQAGFPTFIQIPEGEDPFQYIEGLSSDELNSLIQQIDVPLSAVPTTMVEQASASYLLNEYQSLGIDTNAIQLRYMMKIGLLMLLITLGGAAAAVYVGFLGARVASGLARNLRRQLFVRVENFSNTEFDKFSTASLITRSTNDIQQIQMLLVILFRIVFFAPILGIGGIIKVVSSEPSMSWVIAAAVMSLLVLIGIIFTVAVPKFKIIQALVDKVNLVTRELLTGLMVIRAFNTSAYEEEKFDKANTDLTKTSLFINRVMVIMMPSMMLIMNGVMILIVWVGAFRIDSGQLQVGDMMAFMQYAMQIIMSFLMISMVFIMMPRAIVSAQRINVVLDTEPVIRDPGRPTDFAPDVRGMVEFRNVSFRYSDAEEDLLKEITFTARPGQTTAIIGSTGSGKSTLINLIPRFYDVTGGSILVDGVDVRLVTQHALREKIGYVPQQSLLFSGTIESNVRYGNESIDDSEIKKVMAAAQAADIVKNNEQGLAMAVAQGGANLSGGQKQRLSIARALAKKPEIFIFDDSFSALDFRTDAALRRALKKETGNATVIIVTQRVGSIMKADQIIVLDKGEILGIGKHKDLLRDCSVYREIAESQLSREELNS